MKKGTAVQLIAGSFTEAVGGGKALTNGSFTVTPANNGDQLSITFRFQLSSGTPS